MKKNLMSVSQLTNDHNVIVEFHSNFCLIKDKVSGQVLFRGTLKNGLYQLDPTFVLVESPAVPHSSIAVSSSKSSRPSSSFVFCSEGCNNSQNNCNKSSMQVSCSTDKICQQWHARLGHPSFSVLKQILKKISIPCSSTDLPFYDSCKLGKLHQLPFAQCQITATHPLELVYSDLWGPAPMLSVEGYRYYIVFVDAYTRHTWLYPMQLKSEALSIFKTFHKFAKLQYQFKLKTLQTDNGGEFKAFLPYLHIYGIQSRFSCPYTHQQNGVAERKHRHIAEMGLTLLAHAHMPLKYWVEAFQITVYIINLLAASPLRFLTPFEKLYHKQPKYMHLQPFGCACFPYLRLYSKHKFNFHSSKCVFLGYNHVQAGYKCLHSSGRIYVA